MKLTTKQKQFKKLHGYTIVELNRAIYTLRDDKKPTLSTGEEFSLFLQFSPKTFFGEIKKDFQNLIELAKLKHDLFRRWQMKALADAYSAIHNNQRFYVLQDFQGNYYVRNKDGFKELQRKGYISKNATHVDLIKEAIYYTSIKK